MQDRNNQSEMNRLTLKKPLLEACVETLEEAIQAEKKGAHRIELCSRLDLDGLTPDKELISRVASQLNIPVKVMIRPQAGDFRYSPEELSEMKDSIRFCKQARVRGIVFGIHDEKNILHYQQIEMLTELASPLEVTIHKAIDLIPDPLDSLSELMKIENITSVLTSGGAAKALEGKEVIKKMLKVSGGKIHIIAAGKITNMNLAEIHSQIGAHEYHGRKIVGSLS